MKIKIIIAVGFLGLMAVMWLNLRESKQTDPAGESSEEQKISLGNYYDWQLGKGQLAEIVRPMVSENLMEKLEDDVFVFRLASRLEYDEPGSATITIRDAAYWSDGQVLLADHFVDGWNRYLINGRREDKVNKAYDRWLKKVKISVKSRKTLLVSGYADESDLHSLLTSPLLLPVRKDLISDSVEGWGITIGSYQPEIITEKVFTKGRRLKLLPNPKYYRTSLKSEKYIDLSKVFQ